MIEKARAILKNIFGYDEFFALQGEIIDNVLKKKDSLIVMPTGGGKSLCYQIPALIFNGLTIVISPLISLMKDQVEQMSALDVPAVLLNSQLSPDDYRKNVYKIRQKKAKLLYLAPETYLKESILDLLSSVSVDCLAVDEAHCISRWGHDFRPEYRQLVETRPIFKDAVCIALTATATPQVQKDIQKTLGFDASNEFIASFDRPNLFIRIVEKIHPLKQTLEFIRKNSGGAGIIYCATRNGTDDLCEALKKEGVSAKNYHAGLADHERNKNQDLFINDDIQVMVATIAFGMGINKPDVRFVLHYDLPQNLENYYQEIGRAGRDGLPASCMLLFSYGDIPKIRYIIQGKKGHEQRLANIHLNSLLQFIETESCRRVPLLNYLGEDHSGNCMMCDNCIAGDRQQIDVTVSAQKFLSCVKRTRELFGANHIIDVLRGSRSKKVLNFRHDKLSTYGIGNEHSRKQWLHMSRQFLSKGLMTQDMDHGGLRLTAEAYAVFKGKKVFIGRVLNDPSQKTLRSDENLEHDRQLYELLRKKRKELADHAKVPPYVIFSDKTLIEMATFFPGNHHELIKIHGIGDVKLEKYGKILLEIIKDHCLEKQIYEKAGINADKPEGDPGSPLKNRRHTAIGNAFNAGQSIEQIMSQYNIKRETVLDHLHTYLVEGNTLRTCDLLAYPGITPEIRRDVIKQFEEMGCERLKPVFKALNQSIGYETLKLIRLWYINEYLVKNDALPNESDKRDFALNKHIVCLANSRKYSGRCIAGKELTGQGIGKWVRPVSNLGTGELAPDDIRFQNGDQPELLDIIEINLEKNRCSLRYQAENYFVGQTSWSKKGEFPTEKISELCDRIDTLWINGYHSLTGFNDRIPLKIAEEKISSSLLFIQPNDFRIAVEEDVRLLKKIRAKFNFNGNPYKLAVTDPALENRYIRKSLGEYPVTCKNIYLTVSLGEPYEGYCYKLVAGILYDT